MIVFEKAQASWINGLGHENKMLSILCPKKFKTLRSKGLGHGLSFEFNTQGPF
jgi:hypothetical protein